MKISIITVCKNADKYIEQSIKSVVSQVYKDIEYIIIDGESQDRTKQIISQYDDFIDIFISEPDDSLYQAMNKGIKLASGSFLYFLNSDDYLVDENVIKDLVYFISENPTCDFIYGDILVRSPSGSSTLVKPPQPENIAEEMICGCLPHQGSFAKIDLFSKTGLFNENYKIAADYEWFLKLAQDEKLELIYYPRTIASYYERGLSSNLQLSQPEVYDIQNKFPMYQTDYWLKKRIEKFQTSNLNLRQQISQNNEHQEALNARNSKLETELEKKQTIISAMKTSKFWKIRTGWMRFKKVVGLPTNE